MVLGVLLPWKKERTKEMMPPSGELGRSRKTRLPLSAAHLGLESLHILLLYLHFETLSSDIIITPDHREQASQPCGNRRCTYGDLLSLPFFVSPHPAHLLSLPTQRPPVHPGYHLLTQAPGVTRCPINQDVLVRNSDRTQQDELVSAHWYLGSQMRRQKSGLYGTTVHP